jgi:hypothetical protein
MLMAATIAVAPTAGIPRNSANPTSSAPKVAGSIPRVPGPSVGDGNSVHPYVSDVNQGHQKKMLNKITSVTAAAVVGIAATVAGAQSAAVQWRVEDGGNGHWYQCLRTTGSGEVWTVSQAAANALGGHLATLTSQQENSWVYELSVAQIAWSGRGGPLLGGYKLPDNSFRWVTDEPWSYTSWLPGEPSSGLWEPYLNFLGPQGTTSSGATWNDTDAIVVPDNSGDPTYTYIVEWGADCNNDNITDYGQCHNGTLPDYNGNNVPDCCERGEACMVGSYPVQWRVEDGGNGHWYGKSSEQIEVSWSAFLAAGQARRGYVVTLSNPDEELFVYSVFGPNTPIGLRAAAGSSQFVWIDDPSNPYSNWGTSACPSGPYPNNPTTYERFVAIEASNCPGTEGIPTKWDDYQRSEWAGPAQLVFEYSADCNNDNIVDYGQILTGQLTDANGNGVPDTCEFSDCNHDKIADAEQVRRGQLPDYDSNNIPDCCDRGEACAVGSYPVQWRTADGGNGHWYLLQHNGSYLCWSTANAFAQTAGGYLASETTEAEHSFISGRLVGRDDAWSGRWGPWIGGLYAEGQWTWTSGELWNFTAWYPGEPNGTGAETVVSYIAPGDTGGCGRTTMWNDWVNCGTVEASGCDVGVWNYIIEWSADCNNDGTVDYGQMLRGELPDINHNGTPDTCECIGDIYLDGVINGADLGALLAYWGPTTNAAASIACDLNVDGVVNGSDLGILLAYWGPCSN